MYVLPQRGVEFKPITLLGLFPKLYGYSRVGAAARSSARRSDDQPAVGVTNRGASPRQAADTASLTD